MNKICKLCNIDKPIDAYYRNKKTTYYHSNCLQCVNKNRSSYKTNGNYIPKPTGLAKYTVDIQNYIRESIRDNVDIKEIAQTSGIHKSTISTWIRNNKI